MPHAYQAPKPALGVLALIGGEGVNRGKNSAHLQENSGNTSNSAFVPVEGLQPISTKKLNEVTDELKFTAHMFQPMPNRFLQDYKGLSEYLETVMARDLVSVMNREVVNGAGGDSHLVGILNTPGVQTQACVSNLPTTLCKART